MYKAVSLLRSTNRTFFRRKGEQLDSLVCKKCQRNRYSQVTNAKKWEIVRPGKVTPLRDVPGSIPRPPYVPLLNGVQWTDTDRLYQPEIKSARQISCMRESCARAREILEEAGEAVKEGVTTDQIDEIVHNACIRLGGYPSPLQYKNFPKSVCTSVNNVICHGIPDDRELCLGDIINIDVTIYFNGYHGDTSATFLVGDVDPAGRKLVDVTRHCRDAAIAVCGPGVPLNKIGQIIEKLAEEQQFMVVPFFCGHGIGEYFHGPPSIIHVGNDQPGVMKTGMTFTVEPILSDGDDNICIYDDGWTALSVDDSRSAQFEHTILITDHGADILTL